MTTTDEQAILDYATGRLLANRREFRWVRKDGIFNVGWLARVINLRQVQVLEYRFTPEMITAATVDVVPLNQSAQVSACAEWTLQAPCFGYVRPDGFVLIDGLKRARQGFASGQTDVPVKLIKLDDALKFGTSAEYRELWKVLEATENHPIGARQRRNHNKIIVEVSDDREAEQPGSGRPRFSKQQNALANCVNYYLVNLIELEFHIYENHSGSSLIKTIGRNLSRKTWTEAFIRALYRTGRIPVAQSPSEVANLARGSIVTLTNLQGRPEFKRRAKRDWKQMSPEALVQERDIELKLCAATMRADLRFKLRDSFSRTLVGWENDAGKTVTWRDAHSTVEGRTADEQRLFELSSLDLSDQLMVTHVTGVNMNDVYHDHTNLDPLFQAYAFIFGVGNRKKALADPCMIETIVHRRALEIKDERDGLTESWDGVFEAWQNAGLNDTLLLKMVRQLDTHYLVYKGDEFAVP